MRGGFQVSFRILGPFPFSRVGGRSVVPSQISFEADFASKPQALRFHRFLQSSALVKSSKFHAKNLFSVFWSQTFAEALRLLKQLKDFSEISLQMKDSLLYYRQGAVWHFQGGGSSQFKGGKRTQVMGILNVTPDSFFEGGEAFSPNRALEAALQMQREGADWIDIGGESTRPGAKRVSTSEEKKRILPVLRACVRKLRIPVSVDTYKAETARAAAGEGAKMINDVGALSLDPQMGSTLARLRLPVLLMHMKGTPRTMQKNPVYGDVVGEILNFFRERMAFARQCGIPEERILLDPGFGFGKAPFHNVEITRRLWEFKILGRPLVLGPSRKSTLGFILGGLPPGERLEATSAMVTAAVLGGADFVRVHDVKSMVRVVKIADAIRSNRGLTLP